MTVVLDPAPQPEPPSDHLSAEVRAARHGAAAAPPPVAPVAEPRAPKGSSATRLRFLLLGWLVSIIVGMALVLYGFGPFFQQRNQRALLSQYRSEISRAANEASGLPGVTVRTTAPDPGSPVAILEIGSIRLQQVVVEGVGAEQTRSGPGHVPGTAAPGQPGNAVVVGRYKSYGGPFGKLHSVHAGDQILVTTTQGASIYSIEEVKKVTLSTAAPSESSDTTDAASSSAVRVDDLYGPSEDDRLTLVTSASANPLNGSSATVVTAKLKGEPFEPTPQGGRLSGQTGLAGDDGALAAVVLALMAYGIVMGASVLLYRRLQPRTAYMLTIAPMVALTIIAGETLSRIFPAWM